MLSPLPQHAKLSSAERTGQLAEELKGKLAELWTEREAEGLGYLGRERILRQDPFALPQNISNSPRPLCYTKSAEARKRFKEWYFGWLAMYREASRRFRQGMFNVVFPSHTLRPPLHYSLVAA